MMVAYSIARVFESIEQVVVVVIVIIVVSAVNGWVAIIDAIDCLFEEA